uniref:Uncharacterized protein n=1 Tax=Rhizophora mucronata TaxID=61149 RepID=A0A2P2NRB8_RHIMU
MPASDGCMHD